MKKTAPGGWAGEAVCCFLAIALAFAIRMLEWPSWQNPEYRLGGEMLLATHDAYHWLAGAEGFGLAASHPMASMLRIMSSLTRASPAAVAFWFPAALASLVAGIVQIWIWMLGSRAAGIAGGLIASIAPGFLARTLLGYYDTDLVTLFFPLVIALPPAWWITRFALSPGLALTRGVRKISPGRKRANAPAVPVQGRGPALSWVWIICLAASGLLAWWTQEWHSVFPYLTRYNAILLGLASLCLAPEQRRSGLLLGSLAYVFPALAGLPGLAAPAILLLLPWAPKAMRLARNPLTLSVLWLLAAWLIIQGEILTTLINQINAYLKHGGDIHSSGATALVFPSVAQSIIEVQDLSFAALFPYFHPWLEAAVVGMIGFVFVIIKKPAALFLLPLAALGLLSAKLGGRMVMFGAPITAIGLALPCRWLFCRIPRVKPAAASISACVLCLALLVAPFLDMIPALSQGPSINRRQAEALAQARTITPPDAMLWIWWDWGYAAHYFSRRQTIADGARHGGPSLYLPAAVFATDNPRFARQIIRRASANGNEPGNFFRDMDAEEAQELINRLKSMETPLVAGKGRQYLVTSFEMLRLGFWISNFGNWNFITRQGEGGALSILPQAVSYRLNAGEVRLEGGDSIIFPASISVFDETGVTRRNYIQEWFAAHPGASAEEQKAWLSTRRNINFLFNRVTDEKLAMDEGIYKSLMVQLLLCDPGDPRIAPYFKLVYDNVFARIYEALPLPEETGQ